MPQTTRREEEGVFFFFLSPLLRASMSRDNDVSLSPTEDRRAQSRASPSRQQQQHTQHNKTTDDSPPKHSFTCASPLAATYPSNQLHHNSLFESERDKSRTGLSIPGKAVHAVILGSPIQKQYQSLDR